MDTTSLGIHIPDADPENRALQLKRMAEDVNGLLFSNNERICIFADDRGAVGNGVTDDASHLQAAIAELIAKGGGVLKLTPGKIYACSFINLSGARNLVIDLNGATLSILSGVSDNELFRIAPTPSFGAGSGSPWTNTTWSAGSAGDTDLTVGSTSGFAAGDLIIVSSGWASGVEEGAIDFYTIDSITNSTHLVLTQPLAYNYRTMIPETVTPRIYKVPANGPRNVRITGGTIKPHASGVAVVFNFNGIANLEIDNIIFDTLLDCGVFTGGYFTGLNFHDNKLKGAHTAAWLNAASMVHSRIVNNRSTEGGSPIGFQTNFEVGCHDNYVAMNDIGPVKTPGAGVEFNKYSFSNTIIFNNVWGSAADVTAGVGTTAIRTYAQGVPLGSMDLILGNRIRNVMLGIGCIGSDSVIDGNALLNDTSHANSIAII